MKQIIPCNEKLYAIYNLDEGDELKLPVLAFGLNELGYIIPLTFDGGSGLDEARAENLDRYELEEDTRIADALEGIETRLDALEELQDTAEQLRSALAMKDRHDMRRQDQKDLTSSALVELFIRINTKNRGLPETVTPLYILNARGGRIWKGYAYIIAWIDKKGQVIL